MVLRGQGPGLVNVRWAERKTTSFYKGARGQGELMKLAALDVQLASCEALRARIGDRALADASLSLAARPKQATLIGNQPYSV